MHAEEQDKEKNDKRLRERAIKRWWTATKSKFDPNVPRRKSKKESVTNYKNHRFHDKNNSNNSLYLLSTYVPTTIPST